MKKKSSLLLFFYWRNMFIAFSVIALIPMPILFLTLWILYHNTWTITHFAWFMLECTAISFISIVILPCTVGAILFSKDIKRKIELQQQVLQSTQEDGLI
jgi:hypothetical protein